MFELVFIFLVTTKAGLPGFHKEYISQFRELEECEKSRTVMVTYMNSLVEQHRMFPGVFECRKVQK